MPPSWRSSWCFPHVAIGLKVCCGSIASVKSMYLFRTRMASFMAGFASAAAASFYLMQQELQTGHRSLAAQAEKSYSDLEARISHLEMIKQVTSTETTHSDQGQWMQITFKSLVHFWRALVTNPGYREAWLPLISRFSCKKEKDSLSEAVCFMFVYLEFIKSYYAELHLSCIFICFSVTRKIMLFFFRFNWA